MNVSGKMHYDTDFARISVRTLLENVWDKKIAIHQTEGKKVWRKFWNTNQNKLLSKSLDDMSTAHAFFARHASLAIRIYKEISYLS